MCDSDREPVANMNKVFNVERKQDLQIQMESQNTISFTFLFVDFQNRAYL